MDIQQYIESGILEAYLNGELSEQENRAVDRVLQQYPEVKQELDEIEETLRLYAPMAEAPAMPALDDIMSQIEMNQVEPIPLRAPAQSSAPAYWPIAASIALLLASMLINFYFYQENQSLTAQIGQLKADQQYLASQYKVSVQAPTLVESEEVVIQDPGSVKIPLNSDVKDKDWLAYVYYHTPTCDVYVKIEDLPKPPTGKQYQLWAIVNGVSLDAGILSHSTQLQKLPAFKGKIKAFAITLEKEGGSPLPNLDEIFVIGSVKERLAG